MVSIDGQNATAFIQQVASFLGSFQDLNAQFNSMFPNPATSLGSPYGPLGGYPKDFNNTHSDATVYVFENGTSLTVPNLVSLSVPVNFDSGESFFEQYLAPQSKASASSSATASSASASGTSSASSGPAPTISGYPYPVVKHSQNAISGYFLNGTNTSDVAVLSIINFLDGSTPKQLTEFSTDLQNFLAMSKSAGKTRLLIDIRGNPGGTSYLAYDAFKQLFPTVTPYSGTRLRASDAANALGQEISKLNSYNPANATLMADVSAEYSPYQVSALQQTPDGASYSSWQAFYGPLQVHGDNFTTVAALKFSDAAFDIGALGFVISGYGNNSALPPQVFASENITLVSGISSSQDPIMVLLTIHPLVHRRSMLINLRHSCQFARWTKGQDCCCGRRSQLQPDGDHRWCSRLRGVAIRVHFSGCTNCNFSRPKHHRQLLL